MESFSFVAAGAVVGEGTTVKSGELWVGNPARKLRDLTDKDRQQLIYQADEYVKLSKTQTGVMALGGNVPDYAIENFVLEGSSSSSSTTKTGDAPEETKQK